MSTIEVIKVEKYTFEEMANIIGYDYDESEISCMADLSSDDYVEFAWAVRDEGYTECGECELFVDYDDHSGNHSMCDQCRTELGLDVE